MTTDPVRVVFHLDQDPRLAGVLHCAVRFQAVQSGLDDKTADEFAGAVEDVCRETLSQYARLDGRIEVALEVFADRIDVTIHCQDQQMPAIGLETFVLPGVTGGGSGGLNGLQLLSRVDRVSFNTEQSAARTTLVKFLPSKA